MGGVSDSSSSDSGYTTGAFLTATAGLVVATGATFFGGAFCTTTGESSSSSDSSTGGLATAFVGATNYFLTYLDILFICFLC